MRETYIHIGEIRSFTDDSWMDEHRGKLRLLRGPLVLGIIVVSWMILLEYRIIEF